MKVHVRFAAAVVFLTCLVFGSPSQGEVVSLKQCPAAVQKTLERESRGGSIGAINREPTKGGGEVFVAVVTNRSGEYAIEVGKHGHVLHKRLLKALKAGEVKKEVKKNKGNTGSKSSGQDSTSNKGSGGLAPKTKAPSNIKSEPPK